MTKEGFFFPLPFLALAAILYLFFLSSPSLTTLYLSALFFCLGLLVALFFRDPDRKVPSGDGLVISPADGRIIRIEDDGSGKAVSIFLALHNVHVNRSPVDGIIKSVVNHPGKFHAAFRNEAMSENQRNEIEIETKKGIVTMTQVSGAIARRVIFRKSPGQRVKAGERVGLIRFGSRVDLVLPPGSSLDIHLKQRVLAGKTVLGRMP